MNASSAQIALLRRCAASSLLRPRGAGLPSMRRALSGGGGGGVYVPRISIDVNPRTQGSGDDDDGDARKKSRRNGGGRGGGNRISKHRKERGQSSYKFVDRARIRVRGGTGGTGSASYKSVGKLKKRPDGGHGGHGGRVVVVADDSEQTLGMDRHHHHAEGGGNGGANCRHGRNGRDMFVRVPCGVVVRRVLDYDEVWDEEHRAVRKVTMEELGIGTGGGEDEGGDVELDLGTRPQEESASRDEVADSDDILQHDEDNEEDDIDNSDDEHDESDSEYYYGASHDGSEDEDEDEDEATHGEMSEEEIESIANTGVKGDDGMFHWRPDEDPTTSNNPFGMSDDEWVSSTRGIFNGMERERVVLADLDKPGSYVVASGGGRGGVGNSLYARRYRSGRTRDVQALMTARAGGSPGETAHLELELKLIADLGLVGFPNAGKSSLLAAVSRARPEIAPYPFTTLHPLVGCIEYRDGFRVLAADVPGLIGGAADGRGRGHDFLRHLERTKALLYIVDAAGVDGRDPVDDLRVLADELAGYGDGDMLTRPALVVTNKLDLIPDEEEREKIMFDVAVAAEEKGIDYEGDVLGISAGVTGEGLKTLSKAIRDIVVKGEENRVVSEAEEFG